MTEWVPDPWHIQLTKEQYARLWEFMVRKGRYIESDRTCPAKNIICGDATFYWKPGS